MQKLLKVILLFLFSINFVHSKDITSIPEVVDFGDCNIPGKSQSVSYDMMLNIFNRTKNTLYIKRCFLINDQENDYGNYFAIYPVISEYFTNDVFLAPNDSLFLLSTLICSVESNMISGKIIIIYNYNHESQDYLDTIKIKASTKTSEMLLDIPQKFIGRTYCETFNSKNDFYLRSILLNYTKRNYIIDSIKTTITGESIKSFKSFYLPSIDSFGGVAVKLPVVLKPRDTIYFDYNACECGFGLSSANSVIFLHDLETNEMRSLYDSTIYGTTKIPEFRIYPSSGFWYKSAKLGDSILLNSIGINSCSFENYTLDSIKADSVWKPGELEFNPEEQTIPFQVITGSQYYIDVSFMPRDTGLKKGYLTFYATRTDGEQIKRYFYIETIGTDSTSGVADQPLQDKAAVYPNPAEDYLMISLKNNDYIENVTVYDLIGNEIINSVGNNSLNYYKLGLSNIQRGSYFVVIKTNKENIIKSFLKN